jgi:serine protease Do
MRLASLVLAGVVLAGCQHVRDYRAPVEFVEVDEGHGSAVHIGDGFFLTAAHVVDGSDRVALRGIGDARVMWSDTAYDVAMVHVRGHTGPATRVDCRPMDVGDRITLVGHPAFLEWIQVSGQVSSDSFDRPGYWQEVRATDAFTFGGMSGGPVFDGRGRVRGIIVGGASMNTPFGSLPVGINFFVPSPVVCDLIEAN